MSVLQANRLDIESACQQRYKWMPSICTQNPAPLLPPPPFGGGYISASSPPPAEAAGALDQYPSLPSAGSTGRASALNIALPATHFTYAKGCSCSHEKQALAAYEHKSTS